MKEYKYQMHTHTSPCSACAVTTPLELCRSLAEGGYAGAVLTNLFTAAIQVLTDHFRGRILYQPMRRITIIESRNSRISTANL
ncbi:MAG: hypothetical protein IJP16_01290 [Clostridia bacterium]|nr:hypothetical protein [Clostridia bacterium]